MIFRGAFLKVADNSGAKVVKCLQTIGKSVSKEGDLLVVSVRRSRSGKRIEKGKIFLALLVQCKKPSPRIFGYQAGFRSNRVVLLKKTDSKREGIVPFGTRILKTVSSLLRSRGFLKVLLLAPGQL